MYVCMCMYEYLGTYVRIYVCVCINVFICMDVRYVNTYIYIYVHKYAVCVYIYMDVAFPQTLFLSKCLGFIQCVR